MTVVARSWAVLLVLVAALAPLIANDVPIVARKDGALKFPAFASYRGSVDLLADEEAGLTWQEWWVRLTPESEDWAVMPPWLHGPLTERLYDRALEPPTAAHPFGLDEIGRDLLSRVLWGAQPALWIAALSVLLAGLVGVPLGAVAGYFGGAVDAVVQWAVEVTMCYPALLLALVAAALFGQSSFATIVVLAAVFWPSFARMTRGEILGLREQPFVLAARGLGLSPWRILVRHVVPQALSPIAVTAAFLFAAAIVIEATLAFLGLGVGASWGAILADSREAILDGVWHLWLFPAAAIVSTVWCCHALSDSVRRRE